MYACWKIRDLDLVKKCTDHCGESDFLLEHYLHTIFKMEKLQLKG